MVTVSVPSPVPVTTPRSMPLPLLSTMVSVVAVVEIVRSSSVLPPRMSVMTRSVPETLMPVSSVGGIATGVSVGSFASAVSGSSVKIEMPPSARTVPWLERVGPTTPASTVASKKMVTLLPAGRVPMLEVTTLFGTQITTSLPVPPA